MIKKLLGYPALVLALAACVTINIYFPAAAAEEAARTIVRDVLKGEGQTPEPSEQTPKVDDQQSSLTSPGAVWRFAAVLVDQLIPAAQAAQADININTPAIAAIRRNMERRQASLAAYYRSGAIGFDRNGSVAIRDLAKAPLAERNKLKKLVADENADRAALYREIARANGHPEWEAEVRTTFAKVWVEEALRGYWYQDAKGAWQQR